MTIISIQSAYPLPVTILTSAIDREARIVKNSIRTTKGRIEHLAKLFKVDPVQLLSGDVEHTEENDLDLLELEGELALLQHLEAEYAALETVKICA